MEIRILLDISEKFEKALRRIAFAIVAGCAGLAKDETAKNQDVPAEEAPKADSPKTDSPKTGEAPKKRAKAAKKAAAPAVEISTPAAVEKGGMEEDATAESAAAVEAAGVYTAAAPELAPEPPAEPAPEQESEDELGKGAVGEIISELTGKLINRMNEEARDKATINRNLRAKCEELQLKFPTVPALIQAIGYGNAYKACIGEG